VLFEKVLDFVLVGHFLDGAAAAAVGSTTRHVHVRVGVSLDVPLRVCVLIRRVVVLAATATKDQGTPRDHDILVLTLLVFVDGIEGLAQFLLGFQ
jgi:hypothetical protein